MPENHSSISKHMTVFLSKSLEKIQKKKKKKKKKNKTKKKKSIHRTYINLQVDINTNTSILVSLLVKQKTS